MKKPISILLFLFVTNFVFAQRTPNFIIIYVDDMGYGDLGRNGHPTILTSNLDRMAAEGAVFTNYYSASPACTASRYALLTGKYPSRAGVRWVLNPDDARGVHAKEQLLSEYLKGKGYKTDIFGKWHLGASKRQFLPLQNGFDAYFGLPYSNDMIPPKFKDIALMHGNDTLELNPDQSELTQKYTEAAIDFIKSHKKEPFFIYLPYAMPHTPLFPGKQFQGKSKRGAYGDAVEEIDHYVGLLMHYLKEKKLDKNTYVIFTSDNGPWLTQKQDAGSAGLFRDGKGSTWEGGMRVPFILWGHQRIAKNTVVNEVFTALDILPSFLTLAGITQTINPIDGIDLSHLFVGKGKGRDEFYYFGLNHKLFAVRKGKWKLHVATYSQLGNIYFGNQLPLLFNLDEDPSETFNLSDDFPQIVQELNLLIDNKNKEITQQGNFYDN